MAKKNNKIKGYEIDFETNTFYMNFKFYEKVSKDIFSKEYKIYQKICKDFPQMKLVTRAGRKHTTCNVNKRMTYENMERYIRVQDNADELMASFEIAKEESKKQSSPYAFVNKWFKKQFPDYSECKLIKLEKINNRIISMPVQAEKKEA